MCLPLYSNSGLPAQQEKKVEAAAVVLMWSQTAAVLLKGYMQGVFASMIGLDDFSNWGYRCCHMEHLWVAYFDPRHGHALDSAPQDDYLTDN